MAAAEHCVLDVSTVVDFWLCGESSEATAQLFTEAQAGDVQLWVAAPSLQTLDYVARARMKQAGIEPDRARRHVQALMDDLLQRVGILSAHGFEQSDIYALARDFEDAQIAAAARSLPGRNVVIVTLGKTFDTLGELEVQTPAEAAEACAARDSADESRGDSPIPFIDLGAQQARIRPQIEQGIENVLRHGKYIMGPEIGELEERLADYTGVKHAITVSSGTDALLIALMALEVGPGDEVITSPFSFISTAEVIVLLGAKPVFVDIDRDTYNIDATQIEGAITGHTRAIMPVSLFGQPADFDAINAIAERHRLSVIEDGAQSFGATYKGRKSCVLSTIGCTSFFPSKPLGGYGDSGACFTDDDELAKRMREIRVHGQDRNYHHPRIGANGRMDTLQAAILLPKLQLLAGEIEQRQRVAARYTEALAETVKTPFVVSDRTSAWAQYTIEVPERDAVQSALQDGGVPTAVYYPVPLHQQPAFGYLETGSSVFPNCDTASERVVSLPMHPYPAEGDRAQVSEAMHSILAQ